MKNILDFKSFINEGLNTDKVYKDSEPVKYTFGNPINNVKYLMDLSSLPKDSMFNAFLKFIELAMNNSNISSKINTTFDSSKYLLDMMYLNTLVNFESDDTILSESVKKEFVKLKTVLQLVAKFLAKEDLEDVIPVVHEAINSITKDNKISLASIRDILLSNLDEELTTKFFKETKILDNVITESLSEDLEFNSDELLKLINILPKNISNGMDVNSFITDLGKFTEDGKIYSKKVKDLLDNYADEKTNLKIQRFLNIVK